MNRPIALEGITQAMEENGAKVSRRLAPNALEGKKENHRINNFMSHGVARLMPLKE